MTTIVSLDIGTTTLCALALDVDGLSPLAVRCVPNDAEVTGLPAGWHEQDPVRIRNRALELLAQLLSDEAVQRKDIAGVSITGQMHGVVVVDRNLQPATNLITWRDQRALEPGRPGALGDALQVLAVTKKTRTGCQLRAGYGGATLYHMARNGRLAKDCVAVTIADYITACLCGAVATEPTHAASWGLLNLQCRQWDREMVRELGLPGEILPEIRPTLCPLGAVRFDHARSLGLSRDVQVCSPVGDNQASILGVAGVAADVAVVNLGTGGQVSIPQAGADLVDGLETRPMPFGGHLLVGASLCGGWSYANLRRFFQDVVRQFADVELSDRQVYERMNCLAAKTAANSNGLFVDTRFSGTRDDPRLRGAVRHIDTQNFTPANLARSFVEGMVRELADLFHSAGNTSVARIVASGNAVQENPLVVEVIESYFGHKCQTSLYSEESALGAAYGAAIGMGLVSPSAVPLPRTVPTPHFHRSALGANKS